MKYFILLVSAIAFTSLSPGSLYAAESCAQVIQPAVNESTGECKQFSTPCDVPSGWKTVASCDGDNTELVDREPETLTNPKFEYKTFGSCQEFENVMKKILPKTGENYYGRGGAIDSMAMDMKLETANQASMPTSSRASEGSAQSPEPYSATNVQVLGVDEADTVKTDGKYLYSYQETERMLVILDAKTLEKKKSIRIPASYGNVAFYVSKNKLVLTATKSLPYNARWYGWYNNEQKSIVALYDISDPSKASLVRIVQVDGMLSDSRLADDGMLSAVVTTSFWTPPIYRPYFEVGNASKMPALDYSTRSLIPKISDVTITKARGYRSETRSISDCSRMGSILPDEKSLESFTFSPSLTSIIRFDTRLPAGPITTQAVLSEAGQIHLSKDSIYLTSHMFLPNSGAGDSSCPPNAKCAMPLIWNPSSNQSTLVHRFAFEGIQTKYVYSRTIPGNPLTQYSMDEDEGKNFRIVTTEFGQKPSTRVSILDAYGAVAGSLTNLAPGENFQASRFIGNRLYLVTFEQIDPLFVIDLSDAKAPKVLGELKIPGYSTYLHPYDKDRLIGIGYDTTTNQWGGTQTAGLKVDLYNVADIKNPKQEQSLTLGSVGSSSDVLMNPRAFVWYKEKNLLLLPAMIMESANDPVDTYRSSKAFQGVVGVAITSSGISEKFRVTHLSIPSSLEADWKKECAAYTGKGSKPVCRKLLDGSEYCTSNSDYVPPYCFAGSTVDTYFASQIWNYSQDFVSRALYVGENFYTLGNSKIALWEFANTSKPGAEAKFTGPKVFPMENLPIVSPR